MERLTIESTENMIAFGQEIGREAQPGDVVGLRGPLGAGKTTLVKGIAKGLDITENVTSPSFTIISQYEGRMPLFHMDLYRIRSEEEFEFLGVEEMLYGPGLSVIEWSERAESALPKRRREILISLVSDTTREITITEILR